jgi:SAM-dependent methyltransferase
MTTADTDKGTVLTLQRDLAMGTYNKEWTRYPKRLEPDPSMLRRYLFMVTTVSPTLFQRLTRRSFWQLQIAKWKNRGWIDSISPSLSVGPRWLTEIAFFREIVGLRSHIGLDLFSDDESFVRAGDMHKMPFPDRHFQLIFIKNTMDKSYDIRTVVAELIRVSRPGGIIIVDQICGYGDCSPLTRTDIQSASNLLRLFKAKSLVEVLVQKDFDLDKVKTSAGRDRAKRNVRLALRVRPAE